MNRKAVEQQSQKNEIFDLKRCGFADLIFRETLLLEGVGKILDDWGCSPEGEGVGNNDEIAVPALSVWTLGQIMEDTLAEIDRKLNVARERCERAGIPAILEARLTEISEPLPAAGVPEKPSAGKRRAAPMPAAAMVAGE